MGTTEASSHEADSTSNSYIIDIEQGAETARLIEQDRLVTRAMGGLLPEQEDLAQVHHILDIGCGPGGWVNNVAFEYQEKQVLGIDLNRTMVEYARAMARVQGLENAHFLLMDACQPLELDDQIFELVNARFVAGFLDHTSWPALLAECQRVLVPGGILRLCECEFAVSSSPALQQLNQYLYQALLQQKRTFSVDGHSLGVAHRLGTLLHDAGFEQIEQRPFLLDASLSSELYAGFRKDMEVVFFLLKPYLIGAGVVEEAAFDALYQQMTIEMLLADFTCLCFGLLAWGRTPDKPVSY